jgi:urea transport system permease protein
MRRLLLVLLLLLAPLAARAEGADWSPLASDDFDDVIRGVGALATSGDPVAATALGALEDGRLLHDDDGNFFISNDDKIVSATTGAPSDVDPDNLHKVRVNNAVRRAVDEALGGLRLFTPDTGTRLAAAAALFKSHDPALLPILNRALASEKDPAVHAILAESRAGMVLNSTDASDADRLTAVAVLRHRGDIDARAILATLPAQSPPVANAVTTAITGIDHTLQLWSLLQSVYYGISLGSVLLLAAAGLAITFGVMGVINMAHGEMVMIGAYVTFMVQEVIRAHAPGLFEASLVIAVPLAFIVSGGIGIIIERALIRFLYGRPLETLLATWGLSLVLQQAVRSIFGPSNRQVGTPQWMSGASTVGGLELTWNRFSIIIFSVLVLAALMAVLRYTALGLQMRAVTQNRRMAASMGIRTPWIDALTFGLGSGVAGIAGVALSQIDNVSPNLGQGYIIDSFMVVVFGGVGNLWGTVVGALTLGVVNKFLEPVAGAVLGKIAVLVLLILFIQRKPRGMFPLKGRAVEA